MATWIGISGSPQVKGVVVTLGWTLLHFLWQGAAVAGLLWCALALTPGRAARVRYGMALAALGLMVALPVATFGHLAAEELAASRMAAVPMIVVDAQGEAGGGVETQVPLSERMKEALDRTAPWVPAVWLAGVAVFLARLNLGLVMARRMRTAATEAAPEGLQRVFDRLRERLGVGRAALLLHSARVQAPTVIGWLRPVVLIPVGCLTGLTAEQIEAIFAHELAHIRRHDYLVSVAQSVVEAVLFYQPAVWWVSRQVRRERENCCDDVAVRVAGDRLAYARALSWLEEYRAAMPEIALGANGGVLKMRIRRLLGGTEGSVGSQLAAAVVLTAIVAAAAVCSGAVVRPTAKAEAPAAVAAAASTEDTPDAPVLVASDSAAKPLMSIGGQQASSGGGGATEPKGAYKTWLEQDVLWIITPEERAAFVALSNDEERDAFIRQFWARRDAAGAPAGSFRDEHYARIAYSNEHFAAGRPGWKTDRGHIYIAYGKPESIDSHPSGGGVAEYPYEVWHYRSIPGIGENVDIDFVDACRCGEYHYTVDTGGGAQNQAAGQAERVRLAARIFAAPRVGAEDLTPEDAAGRNIREIDYRGLNSVTIAQVVERFKREGVGLQLETPLDPARIQYAEGVLKELLAEHGHSAASVTVATKTIPPGAVGVLFSVKEGVALRGVSYQTHGAAQAGGGIAGVVIDPTGAVIARAKVTAVNTDTGARVTRETDEAGKYSFSGLPAGPYNVEFVAAGFTRTLQENVKVSGSQVGLNLRLRVGTANEAVTVVGLPLAAPQAAPVTYSAAVNGPQRVSGGVIAGLLISKVDPVYPAEAREKRVQGAVVLHARISKTGTVEDLSVVSGPNELLVSAIDAVRQWKYKPYLLNGEPTEVETTITVNYSLEGAAAGQAEVLPDKQLYDRGMREIAAGRYEPARLALQTLINTYPDSRYVPDAKRAIEDSWVKQEQQTTEENPQAGGAPKKIGGAVTAPMLIYSKEPEYTPEARAAKLSGTVLVNLWVDEQGNATHVLVRRGLGVGPDGKLDPKVPKAEADGLDQEAVEAVSQYKFRPATENGNSVLVELNVEVNFQVF